tara:strand:- start:225 stop:371 length:147 start_codon:yes stop_codon:yes gene_type:complete
MFSRGWERENDGTMGRAHGFARGASFDVCVLNQEGMVDNIVNFLGQDA